MATDPSRQASRSLHRFRDRRISCSISACVSGMQNQSAPAGHLHTASIPLATMAKAAQRWLEMLSPTTTSSCRLSSAMASVTGSVSQPECER
eukprot:1840205-Prymnesium_polylepis.2